MEIRGKIRDIFKIISRWFPVSLIGLVLGVIPLIIFMRVVEYNDLFKELYGSQNKAEFFTWYRSIWFLIITTIAVIFTLLNRKIEKSLYYWPLGIFSFFVIISTVFSKFPLLALTGSPKRHEGMLVWLGYTVMVFLCVNLIKSVKDFKFLAKVLIISSTLISIIGVLQLLVWNPISGKLMQSWLVPDMYKTMAASLKWLEGTDPLFAAFMTFGNSNFAGSYLAMILPFSFAFAICFKGIKKWGLLFWHLIAYAALLACKSRAGFYAGLIGVFVSLFFLRKKIRPNLKFLVIIFLAYLLIPFLMDFATIKGEHRFLSTSFTRPAMTKKSIFGNFEAVEFAQNQVKATFDGVDIEIGFNSNNELEFWDSNGKSVLYQLMDMNPSASNQKTLASESEGLKLKVGSEISSTDFAYISEVLKENQPVSSDMIPVIDDLSNVREIKNPGRKYLVLFPADKLRGFVIIVWPDANIVRISRGGGSLFIKRTNKGFKMLDPHFRPVNLKPVEVWGFEGAEQFASRRGYIWGRTFPLLKNAITVGYGPDTFPGHFPNYDLVGKLKHWSSTFIIIEKPHNMYLQIFFNFGLPALLAFLSIILLYFTDSIKKIGTASDESFEFVMMVGILAGIIGYLAAGVFNDSVVTVAPVFWTLLGIGIAINQNPSNKGTAS